MEIAAAEIFCAGTWLGARGNEKNDRLDENYAGVVPLQKILIDNWLIGKDVF